MGVIKMRAAVFLDRDGVLLKPRWNKETQEEEPPHRVSEIKFYPEVINALKSLQNNGFLLFLVSNQPDYAKGKTSSVSLQNVHKHFNKFLKNQGIYFKKYYYCFHYPPPECLCRKPKPFFIFQAVKKYDIDIKKSWIIGDRVTDILCGKSANLKTILLSRKELNNTTDRTLSNFTVSDLQKAVDRILSTSN